MPQDIYQLALTHSSHTKDHPGELNNERLEFYGDAILKLVISKYLYERFPKLDEGSLTQYRSILISDELLSEIAFSLAFDQKIILGTSLKKNKIPKSIVGDALEAYIAALYIDNGYLAAEQFILDTWKPFTEAAITKSQNENYKGILQNKLQHEYAEKPEYRLITESGEAHSRTFVMGVYFQTKLLGQGEAASKKAASQVAAKQALAAMNAL